MALDLAALTNADLTAWMQSTLRGDPVLCGLVSPPFAIELGPIQAGKHEHLGYADLGTIIIDSTRAASYASPSELLRAEMSDSNLVARLHERLYASAEVVTTYSVGVSLLDLLVEFRKRPVAILKAPHSPHGVQPPVVAPVSPVVYETRWVKGLDLFLFDDSSRVQYVLELLPRIWQDGPNFQIHIKVGLGIPIGMKRVKLYHYVGV